MTAAARSELTTQDDGGDLSEGEWTGNDIDLPARQCYRSKQIGGHGSGGKKLAGIPLF